MQQKQMRTVNIVCWFEQWLVNVLNLSLAKVYASYWLKLSILISPGKENNCDALNDGKEYQLDIIEDAKIVSK